MNTLEKIQKVRELEKEILEEVKILAKKLYPDSPPVRGYYLGKCNDKPCVFVYGGGAYRDGGHEFDAEIEYDWFSMTDEEIEARIKKEREEERIEMEKWKQEQNERKKKELEEQIRKSQEELSSL
jgi:small-conductance mechanosensitive channel